MEKVSLGIPLGIPLEEFPLEIPLGKLPLEMEKVPRWVERGPRALAKDTSILVLLCQVTLAGWPVFPIKSPGGWLSYF